jgi:hypothetical protein
MLRRERDRVPWRSPDGQYEVHPIYGKWSWFRKSDNVQMGGLRENRKGSSRRLPATHWHQGGLMVDRPDSPSYTMQAETT